MVSKKINNALKHILNQGNALVALFLGCLWADTIYGQVAPCVKKIAEISFVILCKNRAKIAYPLLHKCLQDKSIGKDTEKSRALDYLHKSLIIGHVVNACNNPNCDEIALLVSKNILLEQKKFNHALKILLHKSNKKRFIWNRFFDWGKKSTTIIAIVGLCAKAISFVFSTENLQKKHNVVLEQLMLENQKVLQKIKTLETLTNSFLDKTLFYHKLPELPEIIFKLKKELLEEMAILDSSKTINTLYLEMQLKHNDLTARLDNICLGLDHFINLLHQSEEDSVVKEVLDVVSELGSSSLKSGLRLVENLSILSFSRLPPNHLPKTGLSI